MVLVHTFPLQDDHSKHECIMHLMIAYEVFERKPVGGFCSILASGIYPGEASSSVNLLVKSNKNTFQTFITYSTGANDLLEYCIILPQ